VKVVQRVPVKITFDSGADPKHTLRPGMSVEPTVRVDQACTHTFGEEMPKPAQEQLNQPTGNR
jgi:multidrug resistance efflux pump